MSSPHPTSAQTIYKSQKEEDFQIFNSKWGRKKDIHYTVQTNRIQSNETYSRGKSNSAITVSFK